VPPSSPHNAETGLPEPLREIEFKVRRREEGSRLDHFLDGRMVWRSRSSIQKLIARGQVVCRSQRGALKPALRVKGGEVVAVKIPLPKRDLDGLALDGGALDLEVLFEDRWIVAVNKPAGIPVHPAGRLLDRTVITALRRRYAEQGGIDTADIKLCHRLDLETSGVLLVSKDPISMPALAGQFENRSVAKEYLAIVHGEMQAESGEIDLPIGLAKDSKIRLKRGICHETGQSARTGFSVERRYEGFTLVRLRLFTGRHHQLRVHLAAIGHPIVGDKVYGLDEDFFLMYLDDRLDELAMARLLLPRQALHAHRLRIHHTGLDREITLEAPLPKELGEFLSGCRERS